MTTQQWLSIAGGLAGSLGSIVTAFSLNAVIQELNLARGFLETTLEGMASTGNAFIFTGLDERYKRASRWASKVLWVGVCLLVLGFVLQAASVYFTP